MRIILDYVYNVPNLRTWVGFNLDGRIRERRYPGEVRGSYHQNRFVNWRELPFRFVRGVRVAVNGGWFSGRLRIAGR